MLYGGRYASNSLSVFLPIFAYPYMADFWPTVSFYMQSIFDGVNK